MARVQRGWLVAAASLLAAPLISVPAANANFGSQGDCNNGSGGVPASCVSLGNNYTHSVRFRNVDSFAGIGIATDWALSTQYDPTTLRAYRDDADGLPDVNVYDENYGNNGAAGWVVCNTNNTGVIGTDPNRSCRGQSLSFNAYAPVVNADYASQTGRRRLACHELGHTVGLRHWDHAGSASCMLAYPPSSTIEGLGTEDRGHINGYYN